MEGQYVSALEEKPVQSFFVIAGVYVLNPDVLTSIPKNKFFNMTDLIISLIEKKRVSSFPIHEYWIDIGKVEDYQNARVEYEEVFGQRT